MTDINEGKFEQQNPEVEKVVQQTMLESLVEKAKSLPGELKANETLNEANRESEEQKKRILILTGLALAEVIPGIELSNDAAKWKEIIQRAKEKVKEGEDLGGWIPKELYPDIPTWLIQASGSVGKLIPGANIVPELAQIAISQVKSAKADVTRVTEIVITSKDVFLGTNKSEYTQQKVEEAQQVFNNPEENN